MAAPQIPVISAAQGLPLDLSGRPSGAVHQARPPAHLAPVGILWCFSISLFVSTFFPSPCSYCLFLLQAPPHRPIHPPWPSVADESSHRPSSPAESDAPSVQGGEGDHVDEPMEEAVRSSGTARKNKVVLDLHTKLYPHFSALFHRNEVTVDWHQDRPPAEPLLLIDPVLARTWLRPPVTCPTDTHGYWDPSVVNGKLPPNRSRLYPPTTRSKPGHRAPYYHVQDDDLREMFKANIPGTVTLDLHVFDIGEISVSSSPLAMMEAHFRASLLESYTTDSYLFIVNELTKCIVGSSDLMTPVEAMELLPEVVRQSAQANSRSGQALAAGYVCNVVALRDLVLSRFSTQQRTINILRGGDFTGPSLFGPLPESFSALLDAPQGAKFRCSTKSSSKAPQRTSVSAAPAVQKRPVSAAPAPAAKRQKTAPPAAPIPAKQGYFHNKPANRGKYKYGRS